MAGRVGLLNRIVLIGRLTRDPELRYTPSGKAVASITLAVNRRFSNKTGERNTDFIDVIVWSKLAEICANHLAKGRLVGVEGRLQIRTYDTQEGQRRKVAEVVADNVVFLDRARGESTPNVEAGDQVGVPSETEPAEEDDIPF